MLYILQFRFELQDYEKKTYQIIIFSSKQIDSNLHIYIFNIIMAQFTFELFEPQHTLYFSYFTNVKNSARLKENINKFECAFINPRLLCSILQVFSAANRSLFNKINNSFRTQSIYSDIIYYLSPSSSVNNI